MQLRLPHLRESSKNESVFKRPQNERLSVASPSAWERPGTRYHTADAVPGCAGWTRPGDGCPEQPGSAGRCGRIRPGSALGSAHHLPAPGICCPFSVTPELCRLRLRSSSSSPFLVRPCLLPSLIPESPCRRPPPACGDRGTEQRPRERPDRGVRGEGTEGRRREPSRPTGAHGRTEGACPAAALR